MAILQPPPDHVPRCFVGTDVGGTFTDLTFFTDRGHFLCVKVPSTPDDPGLSTLLGIDEIKGMLDLPDAAWAGLQHTHSSTVATNALIERTGARLGFITTLGFRDLMEIQRLATPRPTRYDSRRPQPLVSREMVREVRERVDAGGKVLTPLDAQEVVDAAKELLQLGAELIVISFLHSYRNPVNERAAKRAIRRACPGVKVELSSEVWPQAREFERSTLTAINAYVRPVIERQVAQLVRGLAERGVRTPARGARSNGGMELLRGIAARPVVALLSGPAAGVAGAAAAALDAGWHQADLMTIDVGGTSADIGIVRAGRPVLSSEEHIADFPILIPTIAVSAIGAGGGSIIWIDPAGSLKVGPRSVGADPGPACYGHGATPALTDAFLLAGFLAPGQKLGAKLALQLKPARSALQRVGQQIGWSPEQVAHGAIRIATAMMAAEATNVLARRGVDLPRFSMVAYGGAGPLVAALVAEEVYIDTVLIPPTPGALSALGAARADLEADFVRPVYKLLEAFGDRSMAAELQVLARIATDWLSAESKVLELEGSLIEFSADMRYDGQGYDVTVAVDAAWFTGGDRSALARAFHDAHKAAYGHHNEQAHIWVKELRAHVTGRVPRPVVTARSPAPPVASGSRRRLRIRGGQTWARVFSRSELPGLGTLDGPAIIEQMDTTTLVPDGWTVHSVASGAMVLSRKVEA